MNFKFVIGGVLGLVLTALAARAQPNRSGCRHSPGEVIIYGGASPDGPWTMVWRPFYQMHTRAITPDSRVAQDLWKYCSGTTDLITTTLSEGYPNYKPEVHASLPDTQGGFKITGIVMPSLDVNSPALR